MKILKLFIMETQSSVGIQSIISEYLLQWIYLKNYPNAAVCMVMHSQK